ncbi:MAG: hypothetical protein F6K23_04350 [Okeania sp. SIO2C9]|nr:hypothetical protein [Okeania sp. SIO2C9]NEQ72373.1 hypothetical protein [Okeania sp. SIO2C9]
MQRGLGGFPHERLHQDSVVCIEVVIILTSPGVETPWILWLVHPHLGRGE